MIILSSFLLIIILQDKTELSSQADETTGTTTSIEKSYHNNIAAVNPVDCVLWYIYIIQIFLKSYN